MNLRITSLFFAILLTTLWVFGLMIANKKTAVDQSLILASLQVPNTTIDRIIVKRNDAATGKELPDSEFTQIKDRWFLKQEKQQTRVEGFRIDEMIKQLKGVKNDETADIPKDAAVSGLRSPQISVTIVGKVKDDPKEWTLLIGNESAGNVYVSTPERPEKVFAVSKANIDSLFFKDPNYLRPKHLFNFSDFAVTSVQLKKADQLLELKRGEGNLWTFVTPPIGMAEFTDSIEEKKEDKFQPKPATPERPVTGGVKGLLETVKNVRVEEDDDFVPLGKSHDYYGVGEKAEMRIDIHTGSEKKDGEKKADDKKDADTETLLVGKTVEGKKGYYYARLASDDGVMQISEKWLAPLEKAIQNPGKIRSLNLASFDSKGVDAIVLKQGKDELKFFRPEGESAWQMYAGGKKHKADAKAMDALLEQLQGKKAIVAFLDVPEAELKKSEAKWGLDAPVAEITLYVGGIDKTKKEDKKDEKKDEKDKKDPKVEKKPEANKEAAPELKKDAKAMLTLAFGTSDKEIVHARRKLESGAESRFTLKKEFLEKAVPPTGAMLAYLDTSLPTFTMDDVTGLDIFRVTDKGKETLELERRESAGKTTWYLKDPNEPSGTKPADTNGVIGIAGFFGSKLSADKWVKKLDPKEDLAKYGLTNPAAVATVTLKKLTPLAVGNIAGSFLAGGFNPFLAATVSAAAFRQVDKGEIVTIKFGKESDQEKDKGRVYAQHSGSEMLFLVDAKLLREFKMIDVYDRSFTTKAYPEMIAGLLAATAGQPTSALTLGSPLIRGNIHDFDPDKVTEVRLTVRTPIEVRSFAFARKDKVWSEATGLQEFHLDADKVTQLVKDIAKLRTDRFATYLGGPRMEHKLAPKDAAAKIELKLADGKSITLTVGTNYQTHGYFAHSSYWPETVFFLPNATIDPLLRGLAHFSKERATP